MINPRKLAAIDLVFLGPALVIAEFAAGVLLSIALGGFILLRAGSLWQVVLALYFISLGINYVPMLLYAIDMARHRSAFAEIGDELIDKREAMAKYRRQSLFLLIPLVVAVVALRSRGKVL
jgi:hypothetical protein